MTDNSVKELTNEELSKACGGSFLEGEIGGGTYTDIYRAGVTYVNCAFGADEFYIGKQRIPKATADALVRESRKLWEGQFQESGDLIGYSKAWKAILASRGLSWDGRMGEYKVQVF